MKKHPPFNQSSIQPPPPIFISLNPSLFTIYPVCLYKYKMKANSATLIDQALSCVVWFSERSGGVVSVWDFGSFALIGAPSTWCTATATTTESLLPPENCRGSRSPQRNKTQLRYTREMQHRPERDNNCQRPNTQHWLYTATTRQTLLLNCPKTKPKFYIWLIEIRYLFNAFHHTTNRPSKTNTLTFKKHKRSTTQTQCFYATWSSSPIVIEKLWYISLKCVI